MLTARRRSWPARISFNENRFDRRLNTNTAINFLQGPCDGADNSSGRFLEYLTAKVTVCNWPKAVIICFIDQVTSIPVPGYGDNPGVRYFAAAASRAASSSRDAGRLTKRATKSPSSNSSHSGTASRSCDTTSGGVKIAPTTNAPTMT